MDHSIIHVHQPFSPRFRCIALDSAWENSARGLKRRLISESSGKSEIDEDVLESFFVISQGHVVEDGEVLEKGGQYSLECRVFGGKGGFGSLLRSFGSQISKNRNQDACRDLSGRRLRNVKAEKRMQELVGKQEAKNAEKKKKKEEKILKLKAALAPKSKHNFSDPSYEAVRSQIPDKVFSAVEEGIKVIETNVASTSTSMSIASTSTTTMLTNEDGQPASQQACSSSKVIQKRKHVDPMEKDTKSKRMKGWLGVEDSDESEDEKS